MSEDPATHAHTQTHTHVAMVPAGSAGHTASRDMPANPTTRRGTRDSSPHAPTADGACGTALPQASFVERGR